MKKTTINLHTKYSVGQVDSRVFGGFLEHMGRAVYEGIYDPNSPFADQDGFRKDSLEALRRLNMTAMRYPGGNFASGYHWMDGVGVKSKRPIIRELAWQSIEPNLFGTDEFIKLARHMNWTPMLTVNLGTGTPEEARNWVEYCNSPVGSKFSNLRADNGNTEPHTINLWCLGNEMDGPWQLGHLPADQYAIRAQQTAKMMRSVDRSIELVVCGSCNVSLPTYLEWDRRVLEYLGDQVDYISLHRYVGNPENDTMDYLAVTNSIDRQIEDMDSICRFVQSQGHYHQRPYLCFDEWNVWYKNQEMDGMGKFAPHLIEEIFNLEDALVFSGFLNSFIRHANVLKIANLAQIVNVIAPILTRGNELLLQTIFYPFEMFSKRRNGTSIQIAIDGPSYTGKTNGTVSYIDASAIHDNNRLHLFLINRSPEEPISIKINLADRPIKRLENAELLTGPGPKSSNSFDKPNEVISRDWNGALIRDGQAFFDLPALSVIASTWQLD